MEDFHKANSTYQALLANAPADEQLDVKVNVYATNAQALLAGHGSTLAQTEADALHDEATEVYYNAACTSMAKGDLVKAEEQLNMSQDLLNARHDLTEDDKRADLLSIRAQQVCVLDRLGRKDDAQRLLSSLQDGVTDPVLEHITSIDSVALNAAVDPFQARQEIEKLSCRTDLSSLFQFQTQTIDHNRLISYLKTHQPNAVHKAAKRILQGAALPSTDYKINAMSVLDGAATVDQQPAKKAIKSLLPVAAKRPDDLGLLLVLIQLYASTNNLAGAIAALETFNTRQEKSSSPTARAVRFAPGLVALGAVLYEARNQTEKRRSELAKAATFWRAEQAQNTSLAAQNSVALTDLFKTAGYALLSSPETKQQRLAAEIFAALYDADQADGYAAAGLCASIDARSPELRSKPEKLVKGIDVEALLRDGIASAATSALQIAKSKRKARSKTKSSKPSRSKSSITNPVANVPKRVAGPAAAKTTKGAPSAPSVPSSVTATQTKTKRIKPSRLPKDYDPTQKPDPERWLPMRDRSSYRPAKGSGSGNGNKKKNLLNAKLRREMASQGSSASAPAPAAGGSTAESSRPGTSGVSGSGSGGGGGSGGKSKKKGKR